MNFNELRLIKKFDDMDIKVLAYYLNNCKIDSQKKSNAFLFACMSFARRASGQYLVGLTDEDIVFAQEQIDMLHL